MPSNTATKSWLPSPLVLWTMRLLCLTALSISGYLAWTSFQTAEVFGCSGGALIDCDHVLHSKYAKVLGIPVSVPAFALYATLLSVLIFFRKSAPESLLKTGWMLLTFGSISAAGAAIWFSGLQFSDGKLCPYCLAAHTCGLVLATIVFLKNPLDTKLQGGFGVMAMTGVLALVAIQWQSEAAPTFTVETFAESSDIDQPALSEEFGAPGEFLPPGSGEPEEFGAPFTFNAPADAAPPVFEAPGADSSSDDHDETMDQSKTNAQADQFAALVPPPIDITNESIRSESAKPATAGASVIETVGAVTSEGEQEPALMPLQSQEDLPEPKAKTKVATVPNRSSVEYTPVMEVPVIFSTDGLDSQPADFRSEAIQPSKDEAGHDDATVVPATSQRRDSSSTSDRSDQTATSESTGLQVSNSPKSSSTSARAMGYLFFSASGATNAAISEVLMFNGPLQKSDTAQETKSDDTTVDMNKAKVMKVAPQKDRLIVVAGNRFSLNPKHWPLIGSPDAEFIFVEMFDYTCPHCRVTHKAIDGAFEEYGDRLAVITLPVPLERACNSTVNGMGSAGACEMAKLGVAVWRIERAKFADYHHYMCSSQRTVSAARSKAEELVGKEKLAKEIALPFATDYIKKHVELYKRVGRGSVPKLMFPKSTMTGEIQHSSIVVNAIKRELE